MFRSRKHPKLLKLSPKRIKKFKASLQFNPFCPPLGPVTWCLLLPTVCPPSTDPGPVRSRRSHPSAPPGRKREMSGGDSRPKREDPESSVPGCCSKQRRSGGRARALRQSGLKEITGSVSLDSRWIYYVYHGRGLPAFVQV